MKKIVLISLLNFLFFLADPNPIMAQQLQDEARFKEYKHISGYKKNKRKNPEIFQGNRKKKNYFEGWYFKMVSADESSIISVIPGISLSENGDRQHAFIQIIDGKTANTSYYDFPIEDFAFSKKNFAIRIGNNYFSSDSIVLNIQNDTSSIEGKIYMTDQVKLTKNNAKKKRLAIMGWYRFVPFMQCYHGVVSIDHNLHGTLKINDKSHHFNNGLGYIEKDWGESMPSSWIWIQSNNFSTEKTSFMLSVATIPWLGSSFTGFLGFYLKDSTIQRFGTYSRAQLQIETFDPDSDTLKIKIYDKKYSYRIEAYRSNSGILKAPIKGSMDRRIAESVDATLSLTVVDKNGSVIFQGNTSIAGLEIVGDLNELRKDLKKGKSKYDD